MGILQMMMGFLNLLPTVMTPLKTAFEALGRLFDKLGASKASAITQQAEDLVRDIENKADFANQWFRDMYGDIDALLKFWPGLTKLVYVVHNTVQNQRVDLHTAVVAAQIEANVLKMSQRR